MPKTKECPSCAMKIEATSEECPVCGYQFQNYGSWVKWLAILMVIVFILYMIF
ncbi:MAG: hypothetical protein HC811_12950 [Flammeovirgaceae bacterium]|nr:hypothetical protein [Flammeovirgaceae bacterium]